MAIMGEAHEVEVARESEQKVTPLELFFDLVFVFAITQVTQFMADDPSWAGLARGTLILAAIWWAWVGYAWLTNAVNPDEGIARIVVFVAMTGMLLCALAIPGAFADDALLFASAYAVVRVVQLVLYAYGSDDPDMRRSVFILARSSLISCGLLFAAAAFDGTGQGLFWLAAMVIDFGGPALFGVAGWKVAPSHFAERHGLIVIVALGESIVALGLGAQDIALTAGPILAAALGVAAVACLWWAYFDVVALVAERKLHELRGVERNRLARDSYSFLHLPMILGIVLLALGVKKTLAHVDDPLKVEMAFALMGGAAIYLLAHVAFRLRTTRTWSVRRVVAAVVLLVLVPVAPEVDALVALAVTAAILVALIAYETIRFAEARDRIRHQGGGHVPA